MPVTDRAGACSKLNRLHFSVRLRCRAWTSPDWMLRVRPVFDGARSPDFRQTANCAMCCRASWTARKFESWIKIDICPNPPQSFPLNPLSALFRLRILPRANIDFEHWWRTCPMPFSSTVMVESSLSIRSASDYMLPKQLSNFSGETFTSSSSPTACPK